MPKTETVDEWLDYWLENSIKPNSEKTTYVGYAGIIKNHISAILGKIKIQELTPVMIQKYYTYKLTEKNQKGIVLQNNTVIKHHILLHTALKYAVNQGLIHSNPADKVTVPKYKKPKISFYDINLMKTLFSLCEEHYVLKPAVYIAGYIGVRRGEIAGLRWSDIDFEKDEIYVRNTRVMAGNEVVEKETKTEESDRKLKMHPTLREKLLEVRESQKEYKHLLGELYEDSGYVVVNEYGKAINPGYLSNMFKEFRVKNELPHVTLHGLRHTVASVANKAGMTLFDIGKILGHKDPDTTGRIYTHAFEGANDEGMIAIGETYNVS